MKDKRSPSDFLRRNGVALLCTAGLFVLVYLVVFNFRLSKPPDTISDYNAHMLWALGASTQSLLSSFYDGSRRLWYVFVRLVFLVIPNGWKCAAIVTAVADAAAYFILFRFLDRSLPEKLPRWLLAPLGLCPFLAEALMLPGGTFYWNEHALLGALNAWHNPTNIMVRPFAVAVFYMTVNIYSRRRYGRNVRLPVPESGFAFSGGFRAEFRESVFTRSELVLYPLCLLCSLWSKPSFLQFFAPAIFLFLLVDVIRTRGKLLPFCVKLALAYLPVIFLLYRQFFSAFWSGFVTSEQVSQAAAAAAATATDAAADPILTAPTGVTFYYAREGISSLGQLLRHIYEDWKPIVLFCAFPLFLLFISPRQSFSDPSVRLGTLCVLIGRAEEVLLHETGARAYDGNFKWGFVLACLLLWTVAISQYAMLFREKTTRGKLALVGGMALLAWHMAAGVAYIAALFQGANYLI